MFLYVRLTLMNSLLNIFKLCAYCGYRGYAFKPFVAIKFLSWQAHAKNPQTLSHSRRILSAATNIGLLWSLK